MGFYFGFYANEYLLEEDFSYIGLCDKNRYL